MTATTAPATAAIGRRVVRQAPQADVNSPAAGTAIRITTIGSRNAW
jgi:hypothetical protein